MAEPIALCIEDLCAHEASPRYVQCVAMVGGDQGLGLDSSACVRWKEPAITTVQICVASDNRLVLFQPTETADRVLVHRAGRSVCVAPNKPVVLVDKDRVEINGHQVRLHIHGAAVEVMEPRALPLPTRWKLRTAAAAMALGAAVGAASGSAAGQTADASSNDAGAGGMDAGVQTESDASEDGSDGQIEVRERPPVVVPHRGCCTSNPGAS